LSPAAPDVGESLVSPDAGVPLWHCETCGRLITPAVAKALTPDSKRLCQKCAESGPSRSGKAPPRSGKAPAAGDPRPSRASLTPAQPRPSSASLKPPSRDVAHRPPAMPTAAAPRSSMQVLVFAGIGTGVVILGLIALVLAWSSSPDAGPSKERAKAANVPRPDAEKPVEPNVPEKKETGLAQPEVKPEPSELKPAVPADGGESERKDSSRPAEPPAKPVLTPAEMLKAFQKDLAAAGELTKGEKFSAALELLRASKERATEAPWWGEQQQAWSEAERQTREQLKEYTQEAESACAEAGKADKLEALAQIEGAWKPRGAGAFPLDAWVLLRDRKSVV
jgi:hypothetical protein